MITRHRVLAAALALALCVFSVLVAETASAQRGRPDLTPAQERMVERLLDRMTVREKAGQMLQITLNVVSSQTSDATRPHILDEEKARSIIVEYGAGSMLNNAETALTPEYWRELIGRLQKMATEETRLGIPLIYGIDSVHGANYTVGATIFPHNLTLGATWEPELARVAGVITAEETRACGLTWNFSPVCDVMRHPAWSRVFETFGEDPMLAGVMAAANIEGMQGDDLSSGKTVAGTAKHFLGYSLPRSGRDRTPSSISLSELHDTFVPPFDDAFDAGVRSIMVNSGEINGTPVHADPRILHTLLRERMDYDGVVVTDWEDIGKLIHWHRVAEDEKHATLLAIEAGIDMTMDPYNGAFVDIVVELVEEGKIAESRLDESVRRILALKAELGLFEETVPGPRDRAKVGTKAGAEASLQTARRGITLLKNNDDLLPLAEGTKILVAGPAADEVVPLHGSWTYSWQGTDAALYPDTPTVYDALADRFGKANVSYELGAKFNEPADIDAAVRAARGADVVVLCLGETPATEKPGDIGNLTIPWPQMHLAQQLIATGKPVVLVMITNRPRVVSAFAEGLAGFIWAGHPGPHGSTALAEIIAGDVNPSGRLPFSYPSEPNELLPYDHKASSSIGGGSMEQGYNPLYPFGSGIGYTTFEMSDLKVSVPSGFPTESDSPVRVNVVVRNTGDRAGAEVVQVYVSDKVSSISPRVRRLRAFEKVDLEPGEAQRVALELDAESFMIVDRNGRTRYEPGAFTISVGEMTHEMTLE